jgi:alkaline phosphatase D
VILWTCLDWRVLGSAAISGELIPVGYEISDSESFSNIVRVGRAIAAPELGYSVYADVRGLLPGRDHFYRWQVAGATSQVGRTRTAAMDSSQLDQFRFAFSSCQQFEQGYCTAYRHIAEENLDLIAHLGDYIYESSWGQNLVRAHEGPEIIPLDDYRARYQTYKADPDLQAAHASAPWIVTWDDHELDDSYAAVVPEDDQSPQQFLRRGAAACQAWYEFMPVRLPVGRQGPDMPIHRQFRFGKLMEMNVLDTRQYRSDQACGDGRKVSCAEHQDPLAPC